VGRRKGARWRRLGRYTRCKGNGWAGGRGHNGDEWAGTLGAMKDGWARGMGHNGDDWAGTLGAMKDGWAGGMGHNGDEWAGTLGAKTGGPEEWGTMVTSGPVP
jgi:hypothetical protein